MPTVRQPASFASCPAICPTAPAAAETTTVSPGRGLPMSNSPKYAVNPVRPIACSASVGGSSTGGTWRSVPARAVAYSCQPSCPTTRSPALKRRSLLSTTSPRFTDVMTSPTSSDLAYERASLIRPRWYGSTEAQRVRTSASPGWGEPISTSSSAKSDSCGKPTGRAASVMRRFTGIRLASQVVRLGFYMGYAPPGTNPLELIALAQEAERLGYDSAWAAEAWGTDAVTVLTWLAATTSTIKIGSAIMQIPGRTPTNTAMTAATLDLISGGRFLLGLGTSGPQVVEGWHGQPWGKPLTKTREYVEIVRTALRRDVVEHSGEHYSIPWDGPGATGLGKPLKMMLRPLRADIPIYLAAMGPKNVALATEIADGWLPIFWSPERFDEAFGPSLAGAREGFEIAAGVSVLVGDDVQALRDALKPHIALYVGGMGAKGQNFYNSLVSRYGWEADAAQIQELYLGGNPRSTIAAVPDELVDALALVGPKERIRDRLEAWRETPVTTLIVASPQPEALEVLAELLL